MAWKDDLIKLGLMSTFVGGSVFCIFVGALALWEGHNGNLEYAWFYGKISGWSELTVVGVVLTLLVTLRK